MNIPWQDRATLVRTTKGSGPDDQSAEILFEGTLEEMTRRVVEIPATKRRGLRISLPDRNARPYSYQDDMIHLLTEKLPSKAKI